MDEKELEVRILEREQTTIRLPAVLKERLQREADKLCVSFNEIVMIAINRFLDWPEQK